MILSLNTHENSYDIIVEKGALQTVNKYLNLNRKVLIVTDDGVPSKYSQIVKDNCSECYIYTINHGEENKNFDNYKNILLYLIEKSFTRSDCIVAVGGGVVGDLAGFVAATYMRGIDFYNIPTTLLSQVDSSIGGKTAIDVNGYKNIVGAFYQPKRVIIDPNTLKTLDTRLIHAGLVEAIKMAATSDLELFKLIEQSKNLEDDIENIIIKALLIKKDVVENDPKEKGVRKILNFGHTIGHAVESASKGSLYHGECVGIGMMYMCSKDVKDEIRSVLKKYHLPTNTNIDCDILFEYAMHDKKMAGNEITIIYVDKIGTYEMKKIPALKLKDYLIGGNS